MSRRIFITAALLTALPFGLMAQSAASTRVVLQPGENTINLVLPAAATAVVKAATPTISAPRATCSEYRSINPTSALTLAYCGPRKTRTGSR